MTLSKWEAQASPRSQLEARQLYAEGAQAKLDELVLVIDIEWSDKRTNTVKRTLNEVSILERDMRHGNFDNYDALLRNKFRITWHETKRLRRQIGQPFQTFPR